MISKFDQLYFKQHSAARSKCLTHLHYDYSQDTNRGPTRIFYPLVVDENGYDFFLHEGLGN